MDYDVRNNEAESQFETVIDGHTALCAYRLEPGAIVFTHTEVPQALEGRGIASAIVTQALEHARREKLAVVPHCAYVVKFIQRHPEYQDLVRNA